MFFSKELYSSRVYVLSQAQAFIKPTKIFIRSRNIALRGGGHDKIFSHVRRLTPLVTLLNFGFMICVVWMPVATSLLDFRDRAPYICYAVTLFTTRLLLAIISARIIASTLTPSTRRRQSCSQSSGAIHGCGRNRHDRRHISVAPPR